MKQRDLLRLSEAADVLRMSESTLRRVVQRDPSFPTVRPSPGRVLVDGAQLDRWLDTRRGTREENRP